MNVERQFRQFHGRPSRETKRVRFDVPKSLVVLGKAVAIEYECDKLHGGGDGKRAIYRHKFDSGVLVVADEKMKRQLYIIGERLIVTDAGIEH
jgi:hypothetical protein